MSRLGIVFANTNRFSVSKDIIKIIAVGFAIVDF